MQVAILAGGLGTKLKPLTNNIPKPMMTVGNQPFLLLLLELLKRKKFTKILLLVGYMSKVITEYFGDGSKLGLEIKYSVEKEPLGTAGCLRNSGDLLETEFILLNGDTYINLDYDDFIRYAREKKSILTLTAYNGTPYDETTYNLRTDKDRFVIDYSKSKVDNTFNAVDAGVYYVDRKILDYFDVGKSSLEEEIFPKLISGRKITAYLTKEKFYDIGTLQRLDNFRNFMTSRQI